ncbi:MAG: prolyl oligopeptidase family serine peptidase [Acidobacteria bacterium]|nr:prolyl oligopeptidase family serine peptidase [Acidobacteriota bacterium]MDA1236175.1 prolyl oligopeptidase family serine peptidase [Acidobacteriota bacterium]
MRICCRLLLFALIALSSIGFGQTPPGLANLADDSVGMSPARDWTKLGIRTWEIRNLERTERGGGVEAYNIAYKSGDYSITGFLARPIVRYNPDGQPAALYPAVILNHDGRQGVTRAWRETALEFARRGYVVAASSFRGQQGLEGGSQGRFEFAKGEVVDFLQLTQLVRKLDYVDPQRMVVIGEGHGASVTAAGIGRSNIFRAAVVISPTLFSASPEYGYAGLQRLRQVSSDMLGGSISESALVRELKAREAFTNIGNLRTPVLVIATGSDPDLATTLRWVDTLRTKGVEQQLLRYPSMFSGFVTATDNGIRPPDWRENRDNAWENIFQWVEHYAPKSPLLK